MDKVKVWKKTDGSISVTRFAFKEKFVGESESEFIERASAKLRRITSYAGAEEFIMDETDLPIRDKNRPKWRMNPANKVIVDHSVVLPEQVLEAKKNVIRGKLKTGTPLTDEETKILVR